MWSDVVERREFARQQKRVFVSGGRRGHKTNVLGHSRQRRPQRDRLEVRHPALAAERLVIALVPDAGAVGHKHLVKQSALGRLGDLDVVVNVHARIGLRAGVPPGGNVVPRGHDESAQAQLSFGGVGLAHVVFRKS